MGLFSAISKSINKQKAEAIAAAGHFRESISCVDLTDACRMTVSELHRASLPMKLSITRVIQGKISEEENSDELYGAFVDMYESARLKHDTFAMSIAQMIGQKLNDMGDYRVETKQSNNGEKTIYVPARRDRY